MVWDRLPPSEEKKHLMDKEVTIKLNPRKLLKFGLYIVVLVAVFYVGRFSDGTSTIGFAIGNFFDGSSSGSAEAANIDSPAEPEDETVAAAAPVETEPAVEPEIEPEEISEQPELSNESDDSEPLITTYSKVELTLEGVIFDWKDTWGKITDIKYTITNGESGTIKADHFLLLVEGYGDFEKKISIPLSKQTIKSKTKINTALKVPNGFAYNEVTTGDLHSVSVTLVLYDSLGKEVKSVIKEVNLQG